MSTVLFLNTNKPLPTKIIRERNRFVVDKISHLTEIIEAQDLLTRYNLEGYLYYFDSMSIPFLSSSHSYDKYPKFNSQHIIKTNEWVSLQIAKLLEEAYQVVLFLGSCGEEYGKISNDIKTISLNELKSGEKVLDYCVFYKVKE